jgi:histidinol-phosphatase (PHP family)
MVKNTLEEIVLASIQAGLNSIGFSSHAPIPFPSLWNMKAADVANYQNEIERLKQRFKDEIEIYTGFEIDFIPHYTSKNYFRKVGLTPHYTIASVHYLDFLDENEAWEIDGNPEIFQIGVQQLYHGDLKAVVKRYFYVMMEMIEQLTPDILGHIDKIKIQPLLHQSGICNTPFYFGLVNETLDLCAENDVMVEINNRGIYRNLTTTFYPSPEIVKMMYEKQIKIVLNTDAHQTSELGIFGKQEIELIQQVGYKTAFQLLDNKWVEFTL